MAKFSNYMENQIINHMLRNQAFTPPSTLYLALFKSPVTDAELEQGTLTNEVSGGSYARQSFTLTAATNGASENSATITFPVATANWGTITHVAIMDASTAGNVLMHGQLTTSKTVNSGDQFVINAGDLDISVD